MEGLAVDHAVCEGYYEVCDQHTQGSWAPKARGSNSHPDFLLCNRLMDTDKIPNNRHIKIWGHNSGKLLVVAECFLSVSKTSGTDSESQDISELEGR